MFKVWNCSLLFLFFLTFFSYKKSSCRLLGLCFVSLDKCFENDTSCLSQVKDSIPSQVSVPPSEHKQVQLRQSASFHWTDHFCWRLYTEYQKWCFLEIHPNIIWTKRGWAAAVNEQLGSRKGYNVGPLGSSFQWGQCPARVNISHKELSTSQC